MVVLPAPFGPKIPTISPNKVLIILMHLPSFILYWINIIFIFYPLIVIIKENYLFNNLDRTSFFSLAFRGSIILFFLLVLALLFIKYYVSYTKMLINQIKAQKKDSIQEFIKWLKKIKK